MPQPLVVNDKTSDIPAKRRRPAWREDRRMHRILLVENDDNLSALFETALADAGHWVTRVRSGHEAMAKLGVRAPPVDLVITEVSLGEGRDGWQVARRARARSLDLPVIYIASGRSETRLPRDAPLGVLLLRPFPIAQLVEMAGHLLTARAEAIRITRSA
jgi:DNA-binding response OmpR family regulator